MSESIALQQVKVGDALPEESVPVTTELVVGGAIASRDFTPVHHNKAWAQSQGMPDIIMNILTTQGLVARYVTDWAGIDAEIKSISLKLGAPNYPGDTMKLKGTITSKDEGQGTVTIDVAGTNSWGDHASGAVEVALRGNA